MSAAPRLTRRRFLAAPALIGCAPAPAAEDYFPEPDSAGGWRRPSSLSAARRLTGLDPAALDRAFDYIKLTTKHGGLLVARHGWLVYERYFGRAHPEATPNTASIGKSFTSIAMGILLAEQPERFPQGLDQKVFHPDYLPAEAFPLSDPRKAEIKLGQLLAMTGGIRGNNPGIVHGREVTLDPPGPDGWIAMLDRMAFGKMEGEENTITLWCEPGAGWSYATSSAHLVSVVLRHVTGMELEDYVRERLARPLGWGRWGWGYRQHNLGHTPGGGGIAPRPRDMLRFAYLLLREGRWGGRRLVPASYVRHCGRPSPYNPHTDYSLQFRVNARGRIPGVPPDAFWKAGSGGHSIYIVPSLDLVAFKMGGRDGQFDPRNTGVPESPSAPDRFGSSREGWRYSAPPGDPYATTLEMIVDAIVDKQ